ncbi:MAG: hypothetical protein JSV24_12210, partial [Bacteroidales bacterium]
PRQVENLRDKFPDDIVQAPNLYKKPPRISGDKYTLGYYIDEWGCVFRNIHDGLMGVVQEPLISRLEDAGRYKPPEDVIHLDKKKIGNFCNATDQFVVAGSFQRPFERLQFLRTMEQALLDLETEAAGLSDLLEIIHRHYCREIESWSRTPVDAIGLMDDWGTQHGLMVSPELFRKYFKPMYREYVSIAKHYGKYVFMHSDGAIGEIIADLIEIGIDALNAQLFCMDLDELARLFSGKITFWGEIDRQHILPEGSPEEVENAVIRIHRLFYKKGGVIAQCEFGPGAKPENIRKVFETWNEIQSLR